MPLAITWSFSFLYFFFVFDVLFDFFLIFITCFSGIFLSLFCSFTYGLHAGGGPKYIVYSYTCPSPAAVPILAPSNNRFCTGMPGGYIVVVLNLPGISWNLL